MVSLQPKQLFVEDVAQELEVTSSVVYYWIKTGLIEARKVRLPPSVWRDDLWDRGIYAVRVPPGYLVSTRPVRWVISLNEIQWLLIIKEKAPEILRKRPRGILESLKREYADLQNGGHNGQ